MTRVVFEMPSRAIIDSKAAGVGRNVGGFFASRIASGWRVHRTGHVPRFIATAAHVHDAHIGIAGVSSHPGGIDQLFGVRV